MNAVLLNNITHHDLKIITERSASMGNNLGSSLIFPAEFNEVQKEYPIFFRKDSQTGAFHAVALHGFKKDQNVFLTDAGWQARYIPAVVVREPFLIGFSEEEQAGERVRRPMIHVDMDSPRISNNTEGEPVFLEHGGNTAYLESVNRMLTLINDGIEASKAMFAVFLEWDLIEPVTLDIELTDGTHYTLTSNYTINEDRLMSLDDAALARLHRSGLLALAYQVIASMSNMKALIDRANQAHWVHDAMDGPMI